MTKVVFCDILHLLPKKGRFLVKMNKTLLQTISLALLVVVLSGFPLYLSSPQEIPNLPDIEVKFDREIIVSRDLDGVKIVHGESLNDKIEREKRQTIAVTSRSNETERVASVYSTDLNSLRVLYQEAASRYGIDWKLIEAVHQVETGKSAQCKKSYAGATGPMQFMPSTFRAYAYSGANICDLKDSVFAAANLLASGGASEGDIDSALFNYNHSYSYVNKVKDVMNSI